jgi:hypothetical protein
MWKKYFCGLLLLLFLSLPRCFSEAYLTDEQEAELLTLIEESQKELTELRKELPELRNECQALRTDLDASMNEAETLRTSSEEQKKYYSKLIRNESLKATVFEIIAAVLAIACAIIAIF